MYHRLDVKGKAERGWFVTDQNGRFTDVGQGEVSSGFQDAADHVRHVDVATDSLSQYQLSRRQPACFLGSRTRACGLRWTWWTWRAAWCCLG